MKLLPLVSVAATAGSASAQGMLSGGASGSSGLAGLLSGLKGGASGSSGLAGLLSGLKGGAAGASASAPAMPGMAGMTGGSMPGMSGMSMPMPSAAPAAAPAAAPMAMPGMAGAAAPMAMPGMNGAAAPHTSVPEGVAIEPRLESTAVKDGGIRVTVDYGPYNLPANGMISMPSIGAKTPCTNCFITGIQAKIAYVDGREANIDTGAWLHHMVIAKGMGPIFASGNERTPLRINNHYKYGIEMGANDRFTMLTDLMSASNEAKQVKMQILYEYIPKAQATGYKNAFMKWNDVGEPAAKDGVYKFETRASRMGASGKLLYTNGHVHDGGTDTRLFINNREVCRSTMLYGRRPGFMEAAGAAHAEGGHKKRDGGMGLHVSDSSTCQNFGDVSANDMVRIEAWYDSNKYPLMSHNGKKERLMGIMRVYVGA